MIGIEHPCIYKKGESNHYAKTFSYAITHSIKSAISDAGGYLLSPKKDTVISQAASWFLTHYPLLGGMAASFQITEDVELCHKYEIHIAAVDAEQGSFMLIHPVVYQKMNGSLFSLMNIFMPDFSTIEDAMGVIFICGISPATMSLTTGCMKWKLGLLPRKVFYMMNHSTTCLPKEFMI